MPPGKRRGCLSFVPWEILLTVIPSAHNPPLLILRTLPKPALPRPAALPCVARSRPTLGVSRVWIRQVDSPDLHVKPNQHLRVLFANCCNKQSPSDAKTLVRCAGLCIGLCMLACVYVSDVHCRSGFELFPNMPCVKAGFQVKNDKATVL